LIYDKNIDQKNPPHLTILPFLSQMIYRLTHSATFDFWSLFDAKQAEKISIMSQAHRREKRGI
jgi:hypothetical protein